MKVAELIELLKEQPPERRVVLRARFGVSLPEDLSERLQELPQQELDEMMGRSATAATADEVLMVRLKHIDFRIGSRANKGSAR